jgi:predicted O-methyltransferase YrrM
VDPWLPYSEIPNVNFNTVERNFDKNTKNINIKKFKMFSSNFFNNNKENFDIIYIDGSHKADNVFNDAMESFKILKKGGILLFDDFLGSSEFDNNQVIDGVALFLNKISDNSLKLISINSQICFLKL